MSKLTMADIREAREKLIAAGGSESVYMLIHKKMVPEARRLGFKPELVEHPAGMVWQIMLRLSDVDDVQKKLAERND